MKGQSARTLATSKNSSVLLAAMNDAQYSDNEDDDGEECEEMDMNAEVSTIYSDTDGKHKDH